MDAIYALTIIISGILIPGPDADPRILSGEILNSTTIYYKTAEACAEAHASAVAAKDNIAPQGMDADVEIKPCEAITTAE